MISSDNIHLNVRGLNLKFGKLEALSNIDVELRRGEILDIIGPNGAGKTCLLNCISAFYKPHTGEIIYKEKNLLKIPAHIISKIGISRTFQNVELYNGLSSLDNLMAARHSLMKYGLFSALFYFGKSNHEEVKHRREIEDIIKLLEIEDIRDQPVGFLPYGLRKGGDNGDISMTEKQNL